MKKQILITACSMDIGGIERSLIGLLNAFDYDRADVDLLLFSQKGELLNLLPDRCHLLPEIPELACIQKPIKSNILYGHPLIAAIRLYAKFIIAMDPAVKKRERQKETGASLMQAYWDHSIKLIPKLNKKYDAALSFMWPHHFIAQKVNAKLKLAWVHTDYSRISVDAQKDRKIWDKFDQIAVVSAEASAVFGGIYPSLANKTLVIENILSRDFIEERAEESLPDDMPQDGSFKLLSVGRFCYAKAFDFAAEVCKLLVERNLRIKWYIIGFGSDEPLIRERIQQLSIANEMIILGKKTNPYPYIKACDLYIQPSRYEGKAVTVREAQTLGRPVIITGFKTAASQVKDGFDAVVSTMSAQDIAADIERLIRDENLRAKLSANALASDYSNTDQLERLYRLIDNGGG